MHFRGNLIERNQANVMLDRLQDLLSREINKFIIDLSDFSYMNSTGLNTMLIVLTKSRKSGGDTVVCNVSKNVSSLLSITKLNSVFSVYSSLDEAVKNFGQEVNG